MWLPNWVSVLPNQVICPQSALAQNRNNHTSGSDFTFGEQVKNGWRQLDRIVLSMCRSSITVKLKVPYRKQNYNTRRACYPCLTNQKKPVQDHRRTPWLDANSAQQRYAATNESWRVHKSAMSWLANSFNLGMKNTIELLTEKNNLLQAQQEQLQAKYIGHTEYLQLLKFYQGRSMAL